jgi:hypothetical protein
MISQSYYHLCAIPYFATKNPEISDLIQCTIYSDLIDGENTHKAHNVQYILFVIKITGFSAHRSFLFG